MFAGPEKELLTIKCFSESAFPGEFLSKHFFFGGLECLSTRAISEATTVLQQLPMNQFLLESLTNLPRKIFKYASLHFGLGRLSSIFRKDSDSYPTFNEIRLLSPLFEESRDPSFNRSGMEGAFPHLHPRPCHCLWICMNMITKINCIDSRHTRNLTQLQLQIVFR